VAAWIDGKIPYFDPQHLASFWLNFRAEEASSSESLGQKLDGWKYPNDLQSGLELLRNQADANVRLADVRLSQVARLLDDTDLKRFGLEQPDDKDSASQPGH
jgi:hypothetical protein